MEFVENLKTWICLPILRVAASFWILVLIIGWIWFGHTFSTFSHIQFGVTTFSLGLAIFLPIKDIPPAFYKYMCITYATSIAISVPDIVLHIYDNDYDFVEGILVSDSILAIFFVINFLKLKNKLPNEVARPDR